MTRLRLHSNMRLMTVLLIAVFMALCSGCSTDYHSGTEGRKHHNFTSKLFRFKGGVWTPSPEIPDGPGKYEVSSRGDVWTALWTGGLSRLDGSRWTRYGKTEFGTTTDWIRGGFALRDEEVWAATNKGVIRFDGKFWRFYKDALKTDWPTDMVAGRSGIWVIDFYGNLSHFAAGDWTIRSLKTISSAPPPAGWEYWLDADEPPRLAMTGDGRVWVFWHGLWRQDGEEWREIRLHGMDFTKALLIGRDQDSVWLRSGDSEIVAVTADGRIRARHGWREIGLSRKPEIRALVVSKGQIWIATSAGLVVSDGRRWQNVGWPSDYSWITDVALAPDGGAWVRGTKELP
jgi:hypothetical protein